jgi:hypothetical protein
MDPLDRRTAHRRHHLSAAIVRALAVIILLVALAWEPAAIAFAVVNAVVSIVYLCYLGWAISTGRIGIVHWAPTARRQRRMAGRSAAEEARLEQHRLDAAMSYGSYRPTAGRAHDHDPGQADQ